MGIVFQDGGSKWRITRMFHTKQTNVYNRSWDGGIWEDYLCAGWFFIDFSMKISRS
jgi:hypothetical protein